MIQASLMVQMVNNPPAMQETQFWSLCVEDPLEKGMAPLVFFPGESHGQRILECYSPRGHKGFHSTE